MNRRAQFEMMGLVFVVLILIFGIVLYLQFAGRTGPAGSIRGAKESLGSTSFLTAVAGTTVPECGVPLNRLIQSCVERESICASDDCEVVQETFDAIALVTLTPEGRKYNLSIEGTSIMKFDNCYSGNPNNKTTSGFAEPIALASGQTTRLVLYFCK